MEAVVVVALGVVIALLVAAILELKAIRVSIDSCRAMVSDAVGIPAPDLLTRMTEESGPVTIPQTYIDLTQDPEEEPDAGLA